MIPELIKKIKGKRCPYCGARLKVAENGDEKCRCCFYESHTRTYECVPYTDGRRINVIWGANVSL